VAESAGPGPRVVVIEDDPDVLDLLDRYLRRLGWRVDLAASGEQGMELALADPPDAVLVDVLLPGIDGPAVVEALRRDGRTRGCRIVVTSVLDVEDLPEVGYDAVLPKPFQRVDVTRVFAAFDQAGPGRAGPDRDREDT
jgi:CheY-like chemotaxis protein